MQTRQVVEVVVVEGAGGAVAPSWAESSSRHQTPSAQLSLEGYKPRLTGGSGSWAPQAPQLLRTVLRPQGSPFPRGVG